MYYAFIQTINLQLYFFFKIEVIYFNTGLMNSA